MKQITIISGKGGTGKTVITASFAALADHAVFADCDVDAANLHLILQPTIKEQHEFKSGMTAYIDSHRCTRCGKCLSCCRFDAIQPDYMIDAVACEGCAFCSFICPVGAITMKENISGEWFVSDTRFGPLVHAHLGVAEENSGKLVSQVRTKAQEIAEQKKSDLVIIDGAPGIGCPVIASISGIDLAIVVTEPTLSGLHDAQRVIRVAQHFNVPVQIVVNKFDLNKSIFKKIQKYCRDNHIEILGGLPFDESVVHATVQGKTIIEHGSPLIAQSLRNVWDKIINQW
ncbi:MAG: P-loop NTPase [Elusimicrobia bacterium]|nr:P-loop NTPase [Elusimicrobiota bacterium]MBD3412659.1 P-loop NTPase [Elusimicrobiota bacterium]